MKTLTRHGLKIAFSTATLLLACSALAKPHEGDASRTLDGSRWLMDWSDEGRKVWYLTPQGSFVVPMDIFRALRTEDGQDFFSARAQMEKYGWAYPPESDASAYTVHGLPLGFAEENNAGVPSMGFTCAACHTGQLVHENIRYVIDGGQSMANVENFNRDLSERLLATAGDREQILLLQRDIARINPGSPYSRNFFRLNKDLKEAVTYLAARQARNTPAVSYGNGRIDAFSEILNEVLVDQARLDKKDSQGKFVNAEAPASPISIPAVWTAPDLDCVQTNCISRNPLSRNLGETLGVFGRARIRAYEHKLPRIDEWAAPLQLFDTTADLQKLFQLEESLIHLPAPKWPEEFFGPLKGDLLKRGEEIYRSRTYGVKGEKESCASCHVIADRQLPESLTEVNALGGQFFKVTKWEPEITGTDTNFFDQHLTRTAEGLPPVLAGLYDVVVNRDKPLLQRLEPGQEKSALKFLAVSTNLAVRRFFLENRMSKEEQAAYTQLHENADTFRPRVYKARPLNGIAFSAPFLHNGSVPSLMQLLTPPEQRVKSFRLGTLAWDPDSVGYETAASEIYDYGTFIFDTAIKGNHNTGHDWGTELSDEDKRALIEYLKSL